MTGGFLFWSVVSLSDVGLLKKVGDSNGRSVSQLVGKESTSLATVSQERKIARPAVSAHTIQSKLGAASAGRASVFAQFLGCRRTTGCLVRDAQGCNSFVVERSPAIFPHWYAPPLLASSSGLHIFTEISL